MFNQQNKKGPEVLNRSLVHSPSGDPAEGRVGFGIPGDVVSLSLQVACLFVRQRVGVGGEEGQTSAQLPGPDPEKLEEKTQDFRPLLLRQSTAVSSRPTHPPWGSFPELSLGEVAARASFSLTSIQGTKICRPSNSSKKNSLWSTTTGAHISCDTLF